MIILLISGCKTQLETYLERCQAAVHRGQKPPAPSTVSETRTILEHFPVEGHMHRPSVLNCIAMGAPDLIREGSDAP